MSSLQDVFEFDNRIEYLLNCFKVGPMSLLIIPLKIDNLAFVLFMIIFRYLQHIESVKPAFVVQGVLEGEGALEHFRDHKHSHINQHKSTLTRSSITAPNRTTKNSIINRYLTWNIADAKHTL